MIAAKAFRDADRIASSSVDRSLVQTDVSVAVDEARQQAAPVDVDSIVTDKVMADFDDSPIRDRDIDSRGICAGAVEDDAAVEDGPCHDPASYRRIRLPRRDDRFDGVAPAGQGHQR